MKKRRNNKWFHFSGTAKGFCQASRIATAFVIYLLMYQQSFSQINTVVHTQEELKLSSKILNEERSVLVRLPPNYEKSEEKFPVIYMLDGRPPLINLMTGTIEHLVWSDLIPEMILVSIPNTDRARDMTPTVLAGRPNTGGAQNFLLFLQNELLPLVEKTYRTQPFRMLTGHSLSGLFVSYAFATKPALFNAYLAASPGLTLPWDSGFVQRQAQRFLPSQFTSNRTVFFALGDEPNFAAGFIAFQQLLDRLKLPGLDYNFLMLPEENHASTVSVVFQKGLRTVWNNWRMAASIEEPFSLNTIEQQYSRLSKHYGYHFPIPESLLNRAGYRLLTNHQTSEAINIFIRAIELYPNSINAFDSLSEAYEVTGNKTGMKKAAQAVISLVEKKTTLTDAEHRLKEKALKRM